MTMNSKSAEAHIATLGGVLSLNARHCFTSISIAVAWSLSAFCSHAQNPIDTGILPYHVYQNGNIDHINLDNQALTVSIPLVSYPQRGNQLTMSFALVFSGPQDYSQTVCVVASLPGASQRVRRCSTSWAPPTFVGGSTLLPAPRGVKLVDTQEVDESIDPLQVPTPTGNEYTSQVIWLIADGGGSSGGST
jgi:hypothetical protein